MKALYVSTPLTLVWSLNGIDTQHTGLNRSHLLRLALLLLVLSGIVTSSLYAQSTRRTETPPLHPHAFYLLHNPQHAQLLSGSNPTPNTADSYTPTALSCSINTACNQASPWSQEANATVKIIIGSGSCSGVLLNNTRQDRTPLVLTANHCGGFPTAGQAVDWTFLFNYQSPTCADPAEAPTPVAITGAVVRAADSGRGDFTLLELTEALPTSVGATFAGWSIDNVAATSAVAIGHPRGDVKKIAFEDDAVVSYASTYWQAIFDEGTIEGSSSGSPLFNQDHLVVGHLRAALQLDPDACSGPGGDDNGANVLFPKLAFIWSQGDSGARVSDYLDPEGTGATTLAALSDSDGGGSGGDPPPGGESGSAVHVSWIETGTESAGRNKKRGIADVTVVDETGSPVSGYTVTGTFSGTFWESGVSGVTSSDGVARLSTEGTKKGKVNVDFCVSDVVGSLAYDASANASGAYACSTSKTAETATSDSAAPFGFALGKNYPNPFNPETVIPFTLPEATAVEIAVYDLLGRRVALLATGHMAAGQHEVQWQAENLPSGMYLVRMQTGGFSQTHRMTLLK